VMLHELSTFPDPDFAVFRSRSTNVAFGTKRTSNRGPAMSAFGGKADIALISDNVCY
jgi:hypothetical protein